MDSAQTTSHPSAGLRETLLEQHATARDQLSAAWQLHVTRLEEQISTGWRENVEHVIEERFRETTAQVEEAFARELEARVSDLRRRLRRELGDRLSQLLRRLRQSGSDPDLYQRLLEDSSAFCQKSALFVVEGEVLRCAGSRDFATDSSGQLADAVVPLGSAPALLSAVEGKDTVAAARSAAEISEQVVSFFGEAPDQKVGLFPVVCRERTKALLCAAYEDVEGELGGLELMAMLAGVTLEARAPAPPPPAATEFSEVPQVLRIRLSEDEWPNVPPKDRESHLRAQRFARVQIAEMRLYKTRAVRTGRAERNLYTKLKEEIDKARDAFQRDYIGPCDSMVDYLHLELVRTLANDEPAMLGPAYPGPLV